jgi:FKBP-type peptidyl-prolyl cis-trans isomerase FklB
MSKKTVIIITAIIVVALLITVPTVCISMFGKTVLKTQKEKLSYSIGMDMGKNFKKQEVDIDINLLAQGLSDTLKGKKTLLTDDQIKEVFSTFQKDMQVKQTERMAKATEKNKKDGDAYLEANKKKDGVITLPSGLQYKVLTAGTGETPKLTDTVTTNYRGTLLDGTEFDSSYKRNQPATFPVNGVIPGWTEALQLMKVGSKWQLFIPSNLAYGAQGAGQTIEPNATLIFEIELISINKQ